jgi:hypothetical protein
MLALYRKYQAQKRLVVYQEIINSLGGEEEAPPTYLANRDFAKKEIEYYNGVGKIYWVIGLILLTMGCLWWFYHQFNIVHWKGY